MASCNSCGATFGCACNLIQGRCASCYGKSTAQNQTLSAPAYNQESVPPNTEFDAILNTKGLSKQEKLKRINDIIEKAIQNVNQTQNTGS